MWRYFLRISTRNKLWPSAHLIHRVTIKDLRINRRRETTRRSGMLRHGRKKILAPWRQVVVVSFRLNTTLLDTADHGSKDPALGKDREKQNVVSSYSNRLDNPIRPWVKNGNVCPPPLSTHARPFQRTGHIWP